MENDRDAGFVAELLKDAQSLLLGLVAGRPFAGHPRRLAVGPQGACLQHRWDSRAMFEQRPQAPDTLERVVHHPELLQRNREPEGELGIAVDRPVDRRAEVVLLGPDDLRPLRPLALCGEARGLTEREEVLGVAASKRVALARTAELLERELADRLEHPVALLAEPPGAAAQEALVKQRSESVEIGVAHRLRGLQRAAAAEHA